MIQPTCHQRVLIGAYKIILEDQTVPYTVKRSFRAKHVRIEVWGETELTVVVPGSYNVEELPDLLRKKKRWILDKLAKYGKGHPLAVKKEIKNGDLIPYLGRYIKVVERHDPRMADSVKLERNRLLLNPGSRNSRLNPPDSPKPICPIIGVQSPGSVTYFV